MNSNATIMVISGNKLLNDLMHAADVFEKSKVLGIARFITIEYKKNQKVTLKKASLIISGLKEALEKDEVVSFIHVVEIKNGNVITKNRGEIIPYINKEVRCISDGRKFFIFAKFIEQKTDLKVVTDENMFITGVGINDDIETIKFKSDKE
jgi:hypothetical protein